MLLYSVLNYLAFCAMFVLVLLEASGEYVFGASLALLALNFLGPTRTKGAELKAEVPKAQYWWIIIFVAVLVFAPFFRVATGVDVLNMQSTLMKIVFAVTWAGLTFMLVHGVYRSLRENA